MQSEETAQQHASIGDGDGQMAGPVRRERFGAVLRLTLNRPARRNPLSLEAIESLQSLLREAKADPSVRVIVLASSGPAFSAGHDLKELQAHRSDDDQGEGFYQNTFFQCGQLMTEIVTMEKPVIAEVNGVATAAGCQLVASCDLAYASETSRFATPGVKIGLFCSTPMVALTRAVSRKAAMEMLLTGEMIDAATAQDMGLINKVIPAESLTERVMAMADKIAASSGVVLAVGKAAFQAQKDLPLGEAYALTGGAMTRNMLDPDANEGISAFLEKREPYWPSQRPVYEPVSHISHDHYDDDYIEGILNQTKTIALVGASAKPVRPSYLVMHYMQSRGYRVIPINPGLAGQELLGETVYGSLSDIPDDIEIDVVDVFRRGEAVASMLPDVLRMRTRPKVLWLQLGVRNDAVAHEAEQAGIHVVMNRCPKIEYGRLSGEINWIGFNTHSISSKRPKLSSRYQTRNLDGRRIETDIDARETEGSLFD